MIFFLIDSRNKTESQSKSENFKTIGVIESVLLPRCDVDFSKTHVFVFRIKLRKI